MGAHAAPTHVRSRPFPAHGPVLVRANAGGGKAEGEGEKSAESQRRAGLERPEIRVARGCY